jgi:hypothetical protein
MIMTAERPAEDSDEQITRLVMEGRIIPPGGYPGQNEMEIKKRLEIFSVDTPLRKLSDLVVPAETRQQIKSLLTKIRYHQVLYDDFGLSEIDP